MGADPCISVLEGAPLCCYGVALGAQQAQDSVEARLGSRQAGDAIICGIF